jgi:hypothetical protein
MPENKVGSDVLGQGGLPQGGPLGEKKRQQMLAKMRDARAKKRAMGDLTDIEGKEIHEESPSDQHQPKSGEGYQKDVHVREHRRGKPAKKGGVNAFFERQAEKIREG